MKCSDRILFFFADYWDDMWRRRQQLAWRLVQNDLIKHLIYIERPLPVTSFLKFLMGQADRDGMDRWHRVLHNRSWVMPVGEKFSVITTFAPLPPVGLVPVFNASEKARDHWLLKRLRAHFDLTCPVAWVSHPQLSVDIVQALEPRLLWYDCTEDFAAWPGLPDCVRAQIETTDRWLTKHADVVTAVSRTLFEEKRQINSNTHWLPNAVDTDLFLQPCESFRVPRELQGVSRPVLAFVGGLSEWAHDWELLGQVATLRPEWTFLLIGPLSVCSMTRQMLAGHSNIICVGQKPYQELPAYLGHSDVCFQFYRPIRKNNSGNSQKLFLYLAAGKPVVSTRSADVLAYEKYVSLADGPEDFVVAVEEALCSDSPEKTRSRQEMAKANSWTARVKQIGKILDAVR
ncbi:MAG: glycosyltransferase [Sedimentisphaerales bacterium]|nr:glycosyltransferase [Sedimentisphaerales bacterium]